MERITSSNSEFKLRCTFRISGSRSNPTISFFCRISCCLHRLLDFRQSTARGPWTWFAPFSMPLGTISPPTFSFHVDTSAAFLVDSSSHSSQTTRRKRCLNFNSTGISHAQNKDSKTNPLYKRSMTHTSMSLRYKSAYKEAELRHTNMSYNYDLKITWQQDVKWTTFLQRSSLLELPILDWYSVLCLSRFQRGSDGHLPTGKLNSLSKRKFVCRQETGEKTHSELIGYSAKWCWWCVPIK